MITKSEYIKLHPRTHLAWALARNDWPDNWELSVIGGLVAPDTKQSGLYKSLQGSKHHAFCVGGHRPNGPDGFWIAVS